MSDDRELEDLTNLLKSPGWQRFVASMKAEWGEHIANHLRTAASDRDDVMAANKIRQVVAAKDAIERALAWPADRVKTLEHPTHAPLLPAMSRGGY